MSDHVRAIAEPFMHLLAGVAMAAAYALFAYAHGIKFAESGRVAFLFFVAAESLIALLFLLRTQPKSFASSPVDWAVAALGTWLPLFLRPTSESLVPGADWGIAIGATLQILGVLSLNRSFAIVPALRELKTRGMYRWVRHPIYASYLISQTAYVVGNWSARNALIWLLSMLFLLGRIHLEERHLARTPGYREYMRRVRWRLIPHLY